MKFVPAKLLLTLVSLAFLQLRTADGAVVVGGSDLLTSAYASQLETWLGQGAITLTNIFDHTSGDGKTSVDFHTAADGKGPTISVIKVLNGSNGLIYDGNVYPIGEQIIGGYNPQSWNSGSGSFFPTPNYTVADSERTAFLFNLTGGVKQDQKLSTQTHNGIDVGTEQTYGSPLWGPIFGGGHDLSVEGSLNLGSAYNISFGNGAIGQDDILNENIANLPVGTQAYGGNLILGDIEVFTISAVGGTVTPEPWSFIVWGGLIGGVFFVRRNRLVECPNA